MRFLVIAAASLALVLAVASAVIAGPEWNLLGGPGDPASTRLTDVRDGQGPQVTRLVPSTRPLTSDEMAAFRTIYSDVAPDSIPIAHARTQFDGETWSFTTWRNRANEVCHGTNVPGEGHSRSCASADQLFADWPIRIARGAREKTSGWHVVWLEGLASPKVRSMILVTADCRRRPIDVDSDGAFFHLISGVDATAGEWPIRVEAYDAAGAVLYSTRVLVTTPDTQSPLAADQPSCP